MNWFLIALKKYVVFEGRSRRAEYWYFVLFSVPIGIAAAVVDRMFGTPLSKDGAVQTLVALGLTLPGLGVSIRRLHDTNRSGWWLVAGLIPIVGAVLLIVFYATDGDPGENRFGPDPKALTLEL